MKSEIADFFISYTGKDAPWAEWTAWTLEEAGYLTRIQAWDFKAGKSFVQLMDEATSTSKQTIAIISDNYFTSEFGRSEWYAAFARDPEGKGRILIPVRVAECDVKGLMSQVIYIDLVGADEEDATQRLICGVADKRAKPIVKPSFPGATTEKPTFPGSSIVPAEHEKNTHNENPPVIAPHVVRGMRKAISDDLRLELDAPETLSTRLHCGIYTIISGLLIAASLEIAFSYTLPSHLRIPLAVVIGITLPLFVAKPMASLLVKLKPFRRLLMKKYWIEGFWHIKTFDFARDDPESTGLVEIRFVDFPLCLHVKVIKLKSANIPHPTTSTSEHALLSGTLKYWNKWSYTEAGDSVSGYASGVFDRKPPTAPYPNDYQGVLIFSDGRPQKMQRAVRIMESQIREYRKQHGERWREALLLQLEESRQL
jgi:hypothetical protein